MNTNNFGQMLMIIGVAIFLVMFFLADWSGQLGFMQNIRYAELLCIEYEKYGYKCESGIKLGQGLILPLILISLGLMINRNIISEKLMHKLLPFIHLSKSNDDKQDTNK